MSSGILEGYGAMIDGLMSRFKSRFGNKLRVIATGGFSSNLKPFAHSFDILDIRHSIKSLLIIFKDFRTPHFRRRTSGSSRKVLAQKRACPQGTG
jgi:type III pantothenate kinase